MIIGSEYRIDAIGKEIKQALVFFPPDVPLPIGTRLEIVALDECLDFHWGRCVAAKLIVVSDDNNA